MKSFQWQNIGAPLIVGLLTLALAWPTLFFPWSLIDDPSDLRATRAMDQALREGRWGDFRVADTGRVRPGYWVILWAEYALFKFNPLGHHAARVAQFVWCGMLAVLIGRDSFGSWGVGVLGGGLFVLSGPYIELWLRLGPQEPLLVLCFGTSLWLLLKAARALERRQSPLGWFAASFVFSLVGYTVKESAVVMLPVSGFVLLTGQRWPEPASRRWRTWAVLYLLVNGVLASGLAAFIITVLGQGSAGSYTSRYAVRDLEKLATTALTYLALLFEAYLPLLPLLALGAIRWRSLATLIEKMDSDRWLLVWLAWTVGFLLVQIPWGLAQTYYTLPSAFGLCVILGLFLNGYWQSFGELSSGKIAVLARGPIVLCGLAFIGVNLLWSRSIVNQLYSRHITDMRVVQFLAGAASPDHRLVFNSDPARTEWGPQIGIYLELFYGWERPRIDHVQPSTRLAPGDFLVSRGDWDFVYRPDTLPEQFHFRPSMTATVGFYPVSWRVYEVGAILSEPQCTP